MPKKVERALKKQAKKKGFGKKRTGAYVFGTLAKMGGTQSRMKKKKKAKKGKTSGTSWSY